jgi:hypothetical protein
MYSNPPKRAWAPSSVVVKSGVTITRITVAGVSHPFASTSIWARGCVILAIDVHVLLTTVSILFGTHDPQIADVVQVV